MAQSKPKGYKGRHAKKGANPASKAVGRAQVGEKSKAENVPNPRLTPLDTDRGRIW